MQTRSGTEPIVRISYCCGSGMVVREGAGGRNQHYCLQCGKPCQTVEGLAPPAAPSRPIVPEDRAKRDINKMVNPIGDGGIARNKTVGGPAPAPLPRKK